MPKRFAAHHLKIGDEGEKIAVQYLQRNHFRIIHQNWRTRTGELDIVAMDGDTLVFFEVRMRHRSARFGSAEQSIDAKKQIKIRRTAERYMYTYHLHDAVARFDVIAIEYDNDNIHINHIKQAF